MTAKEIIRVEPLSTYRERWKAPTSAVTRAGGTVYVSGFPSFDPVTGEIAAAPIERQTELVLDQMKLCLASRKAWTRCRTGCSSPVPPPSSSRCGQVRDVRLAHGARRVERDAGPGVRHRQERPDPQQILDHPMAGPLSTRSSFAVLLAGVARQTLAT